MCYILITLHRFWQIFGAIGSHNSEPPNIILVIGIGIVRAQVLQYIQLLLILSYYYYFNIILRDYLI